MGIGLPRGVSDLENYKWWPFDPKARLASVAVPWWELIEGVAKQ